MADGCTGAAVCPDATAALVSYSWPANVRELKHLIGRAALLSKANEISAADLGLSSAKKQQSTHVEPVVGGLTIDAAERLLMEEVLRICAGNVSEAARRLGLARMAMRYRMQKHGLKES